MANTEINNIETRTATDGTVLILTDDVTVCPVCGSRHVELMEVGSRWFSHSTGSVDDDLDQYVHCLDCQTDFDKAEAPSVIDASVDIQF